MDKQTLLDTIERKEFMRLHRLTKNQVEAEIVDWFLDDDGGITEKDTKDKMIEDLMEDFMRYRRDDSVEELMEILKTYK